LNLIVGLCRPQTVKKVIEVAVTVGIESLHFVRCERSEKSYLHSDVLSQAKMNTQVHQVLEQVWDARAPEIVIHPRFREFAEDVLGSQRRLMLADCASDLPDYSELLAVCSESDSNEQGSRWIAVGPEAGWNAFERTMFLNDLGAKAFSLGPRILRTEQAAQAICFRGLR
jgi:RsmE family RNA methyltransferase